MKNIPILASAFLALGGFVCAQTPIRILNPGFTDGAGSLADPWISVNGGGTNNTPSNYAETIPGSTWGRSMQLKSDGGNYIQQTLGATEDDTPVTASSFGTWLVSFERGYRRDAVRNGDHTLRVSLWDLTADAELAGASHTIPDPGSTGTNTLDPVKIVLSYDETDPAIDGHSIALRVASTSSDLGINAWQRTAAVDNFSVSAGGIDPRIAADPVPAISGNGTSSNHSIGFFNPGSTQNLEVSSVTLSGPDASAFSVLGFTTSVAPGGSGVIDIQFHPSAGGVYQADLVVTSNALDYPTFTIPLSANVVDPVLTLGSDLLDFGSLEALPGPRALELALVNDGGISPLEILSASFLGGGNGFTVDSAPAFIPPGQNSSIVVGFDPATRGGHFGDILEITTNAAVNPVRRIPVKAFVAFTASPTPLTIANGDFNANTWNSGLGSASQGWSSSLAAANTLGNYGQTAPNTPNLASIAAHLQAAGGYYQQSLTSNNAGFTASASGEITVNFDAGYRNDAVTGGPILLRVSLWDETGGIEIDGRDIVLVDPGVQSGASANQLSPVGVVLGYTAGSYTDESLALRISQRSPSLSVDPWRATAIVDNVTASTGGSWEPPLQGFASWAAAQGLDGTPGKENGPDDDPDRDGQTNLGEFAFGGIPLSGSLAGWSAVVLTDTDADSARELILTLAVREGASFSPDPSPSASIDGIRYTIQGSLNLEDFDAAVEGPLPDPVIPPSFPPTPPDGYEYRSFRLSGSAGLPLRGFLRASVVEE